MTYVFDILIIGGGHAGVEAALIARKMGRQVGLVSLDHSKTGRMSCNPAIGGMGKTHIAREVDALGGYIAEATDLAGIQFRVLNRKKGPAVQATRIQTCREHYELLKKDKTEHVCLNLTKKHFSWYLKGFNGAVEWRRKFMYANSVEEVDDLLKLFEKEVNPLGAKARYVSSKRSNLTKGFS